MNFTLDGVVNAAGEQRTGSAETAALRALFHDVANHLATFSCLLDAVDADAGMSAPTRAQVAMMRTHTARMLALLRESVDGQARPVPVEVHGLLREVVSAADAGGTATVALDAVGARWLRTYPAALWRVVANVVDNAVRAAGAGGRVTVAVRGRRGAALIEVVDDGPGFGNAPRGTAAMGLPIAAELTGKCGGNVRILPVDPHGVRVSLEFPDLAARSVGGPDETVDDRRGEWR